MTQPEVLFVLGFMAISLWRGSFIWKVIAGLMACSWAFVLYSRNSFDYSIPLLAAGLYMLIDGLMNRSKTNS